MSVLASCGETVPLSYSQQLIWQQIQMYDGRGIVPLCFRVSGPLDVGALEAGLNDVAARHSILSATFPDPEEPLQAIGDRVTLSLKEISEWHEEDEALAFARASARRPFDLTAGPLVRARLAKVSDRQHLLSIELHHLVSDNWSTNILTRELWAAYAARSTGGVVRLDALPIQYVDHVRRQYARLEGTARESLVSFWRHHLRGLTSLRPLGRETLDETQRSTCFALSGAAENRLALISRRDKVTRFATLLFAMRLLICRYTNRADVAIVTSTANRLTPDTERLIGLFSDMVPLRFALPLEQSLGHALRASRTSMFEALEHQQLPFVLLTRELRSEFGRFLPCAGYINMIDHDAAPTSVGRLEVRRESWLSDTFASPLHLNIVIRRVAGRLHVAAFYDRRVFDEVRMTNFRDDLDDVLLALAAAPDTRLAEVTHRSHELSVEGRFR